MEGQMKLSELKPCASCGGPLLRPPAGAWYVIRQTQAMVNPVEGNRVLGMAQFFQGNVGLAEAFETSKPVRIFGDIEPALMNEVHVCFECWTSRKFDGLRDVLEKSEAKDMVIE